MSTGFRCIACSLEFNRAIALNAAPQDAENNQVADHFNGKKHAKSMMRFGADLFSEHNVRKFFGEVLGQTAPDLQSKIIVQRSIYAVGGKSHNPRGDLQFALIEDFPPI